MSGKNILVVSVDIRETRVALIEDGIIAELHIERRGHGQTGGSVGDVFLGKVTRVLPGLQAAFIDIGLERAAFLHVEDLIRPTDFEAYLAGGRKHARGETTDEEATPADAEEGEAGVEGEAEAPAEITSAEARGEREREARSPGREARPAGEARGRSGRGGEARGGEARGGEARGGEARGGEARGGEARGGARSGGRGGERSGGGRGPAAGGAASTTAPAVEGATPGRRGRGRDSSRPREGRGPEAIEPAVAPPEVTTLDPDMVSSAPELPIALPSTGSLGSEDDLEVTRVYGSDFLEPPPAQARDEDELSADDAPQDDDDDASLAEEALAAAVSEPELATAEDDEDDADADADAETDADADVDDETDDDEDDAGAEADDDDDEGNDSDPPAAAASKGLGDLDMADLPGFTITEPGESVPVPRASMPRVDDAARRSDGGRRRGRRGRSRGGDRPSGDRPSGDRQGGGGGGERSARAPGGGGGRRDRGGGGNGDRNAAPGRISKSTPIRDVVREGQEIIVQITKEPIGTKGARCSSHISLPGRYVVYLPTVDHIGVSKRIGSEKERARLRESIEGMKPPTGGLIVRTVAEGLTKKQLKQDVGYLVRLWGEIAKKREGQKAPHCLSSELDLVLKTARDLFTDEVDQIVIDDKYQHDRLCRFVEMFMPERMKDIQLYQGEEPIFDAYGIEDEIGRALARKVPLPSGGHLIIDQAEALTAIDVNTGRFVGKGSKDMEETILKTNLEAVHEIAYQLRFRNIGGLIILDLIDMEKSSSREKVRRALEDILQKDKAKTSLNRISELGLIEMTRKRTRESLGRLLHEPCFYCDGTGQLQSKETIAYEILREIRRRRQDLAGYSIIVNAHPSVADLLTGSEKDAVAEAENRYMRKIIVVPRKEYHYEQFDLAGK